MIWSIFCEISAPSGQGLEKADENDQRTRKNVPLQRVTLGFINLEREVNCKAKACWRGLVRTKRLSYFSWCLCCFFFWSITPSAMIRFASGEGCEAVHRGFGKYARALSIRPLCTVIWLLQQQHPFTFVIATLSNPTPVHKWICWVVNRRE